MSVNVKYLKPIEVVALAAERNVKLSLATLANRRSAGRPPESRRIAGRAYYPETAVEAWLNEGEQVGERLDGSR